jgi:hypothetical protein
MQPQESRSMGLREASESDPLIRDPRLACEQGKIVSVEQRCKAQENRTAELEEEEVAELRRIVHSEATPL